QQRNVNNSAINEVYDLIYQKIVENHIHLDNFNNIGNFFAGKSLQHESTQNMIRHLTADIYHCQEWLSPGAASTCLKGAAGLENCELKYDYVRSLLGKLPDNFTMARNLIDALEIFTGPNALDPFS